MKKRKEEREEERKKKGKEEKRKGEEKRKEKEKILCFDEMQITDITDAMIVGRLFEFFLDAGIIIVSTSNRHPDELYKNGLNRALFLPFIKMLKQELYILNLDSTTDHRQKTLANNTCFFYPLNEQTFKRIDNLWRQLSKDNSSPLILRNKKRDIKIPHHNNGIAREEAHVGQSVCFAIKT